MIVAGSALAAVALAIYWPLLAQALRLQSLDGASLALAVACGLPGLLVWLILRLLRR